MQEAGRLLLRTPRGAGVLSACGRRADTASAAPRSHPDAWARAASPRCRGAGAPSAAWPPPTRSVWGWDGGGFWSGAMMPALRCWTGPSLRRIRPPLTRLRRSARTQGARGGGAQGHQLHHPGQRGRHRQGGWRGGGKLEMVEGLPRGRQMCRLAAHGMVQQPRTWCSSPRLPPPAPVLLPQAAMLSWCRWHEAQQCPPCRIVAQIHDELILEVDASRVDAAWVARVSALHWVHTSRCAAAVLAALQCRQPAGLHGPQWTPTSYRCLLPAAGAEAGDGGRGEDARAAGGYNSHGAALGQPGAGAVGR